VSLAYFIFITAQLAVCALAAFRGGRDERLAATALALAAVLSPMVLSHGFAGPEAGILLVDAALFAALSAIAMRSKAFWPIWAAGFQLCALAGHLAASHSPKMLPATYADTLAIWSYAVMVTLALGTIVEGQERHGRR
jgi:hypothetical protein